MPVTSHRLFAAVVGLFVTDAALAQNRFSVATPKRPTFELSAVGTKLAPELRPAVHAGAPFLGLTREGDPVLEFAPDVRLQNAKERIESVALPARQLASVADVVRVRRLIVFVDAATVNADAVAGLPVIGRNPTGRYVVVEAPAPVTPDGLQQLVDSRAVRYVEPSFPYYVDRAPNDPYYKDAGLWGLKSIHVDAAWDVGTGAEVTVAVLDTGVDYEHPDIAANILPEHRRSFLDGGDRPLDAHGHGTHVAGTIGAIGDNGVGVAGVAWKVRIMPLQIFGKDGEFAGPDKVAEAIDFAVANGAKVINNSWGGPNFSQAIKEALNRAERADVLVVAAAGNQFGNDNDDSPRYPASYGNQNIIAVMSVDPGDGVSGFSNHGRTSVHIAAPGAGIESLLPGNRYGVMSGTSMATPHVAGAAALLWSMPQYRDRRAADIKRLILDNARPVAALKDKNITGATLDLAFLGGGLAKTLTLRPATITGLMQAPHFAIGAETTGAILRTRRGPVEIDTPPDMAAFRALLEHLDGEQVTITGARGSARGLARPDRPTLEFMAQ